ncbi:unnamed protein product [Owenia fusiformis]|uniref:Uncharacterized protein n=1 Tax=Owenia fusiformis TaxID=6347 RepID=A0A8J1UKR4_OWEFU|nr:unnamed protein product [Owenia fusiformis]
MSWKRFIDEKANLFPIAQEELFHIYEALQRQMKQPIRTSNPYRMKITRDCPYQVFNMLYQIGTTNMWETFIKETETNIMMEFHNDKKLIFWLDIMNKQGFKNIEKCLLIEKRKSDGSRMKVLVNDVNPFTIRFSKRQSKLHIDCCFGFWNMYGVRQHPIQDSI